MKTINRTLNQSRIACSFLLLVSVITAWAQPLRDESGEVDVMIVEGEEYVIDTILAMERLTESNGKGARLYKQGRYREAIPYLLVGARTGFKMSQARLGAIYLAGLGDVERDIRKGLGWLGAASQPTTSPDIRLQWKKILEQITPEQLPAVNEIVQAYRQKYGRNATGTDCEMTSNTKSFVARLECTLADELLKFASNDQKLMINCVTTHLDSGNCMGIGGFEARQGEYMNSLIIGGGGSPF